MKLGIWCLALTALLCVANVAGADTLLSLHKPVTGGTQYSDQWPLSSITDGYFDDTLVGSGIYSYWITPDKAAVGNLATINLEGLYRVTSFRVQDTCHTGWWDRGTEAFLIQVSTNGSDFTTVVDSSFTWTEWRYLALKTYDLVSPVEAQYVRFVVQSAYMDYRNLNSGGINELEVYGSAVPLPGALWLLGSGLAVIGLRRRFRG